MDMIYHYTTLSNLLKMWHERTDEEFEITKADHNNVDWSYYLNFHASDVRMMNDIKENKLINDVIQKAPNELWIPLGFETGATSSLYAISFCKKKDYVPMWKEYASDDGICLGFCADEFESKTIKLNKSNMCNSDNFCLEACNYLSPSTMKKGCINIIKKLEEILGAHGGDILPVQRKIRQMVLQSAFCKLKDFEYEQEVRLATFAPSWDSKIKEGRDGVTVYKALKVPLSLLKVIIISPLAKNKDIIQVGIDKLLFDLRHTKRYGIDIKVEHSKLEIR